MKTCWFLIIQSRDLWWVDCEGKSYGPFKTMGEARSNAICFAEIFADPPRGSQVFAPDETGRLTMIWNGGSTT